MPKIITARSGEVWGDVVGGFIYGVESRRKFAAVSPDLQERFDSKAWAMVCARQRLSEGYASVIVFRIVALTIADDEDPCPTP